MVLEDKNAVICGAGGTIGGAEACAFVRGAVYRVGRLLRMKPEVDHRERKE